MVLLIVFLTMNDLLIIFNLRFQYKARFLDTPYPWSGSYNVLELITNQSTTIYNLQHHLETNDLYYFMSNMKTRTLLGRYEKAGSKLFKM